jgi:ribosomal protein S2
MAAMDGGNLTPLAMKDLLEAGVHFGHQTKRWNPKMKPFIFGERSGIYILDLGKTVKHYREAEGFVRQLAAEGKSILFVGTKRQAQDVVAEEATRCGMYYVNERWLGGLLTNFTTIQRSLNRLRDLEAMSTDGRYETMPKKEIAKAEKEKRACKDVQGNASVLVAPLEVAAIAKDSRNANARGYPYYDPFMYGAGFGYGGFGLGGFGYRPFYTGFVGTPIIVRGGVRGGGGRRR